MPLEKEVMKLLKSLRKYINQSCVRAFSLEERVLSGQKQTAMGITVPGLSLLRVRFWRSYFCLNEAA